MLKERQLPTRTRISRPLPTPSDETRGLVRSCILSIEAAAMINLPAPGTDYGISGSDLGQYHSIRNDPVSGLNTNL